MHRDVLGNLGEIVLRKPAVFRNRYVLKPKFTFLTLLCHMNMRGLGTFV
jgi:hypothetical protein